uniref:C-type lectin domain-containing protein n=1 Tax=Monopterus albus TaxID=43700 RepID=A0A3Q3KRA2_MONAL
MNLIKTKGTLGVRGYTILYVLLSLLISETSQADSPETELSLLKLRLSTLRNQYRLLCKQYSDLARSCSAPVSNCSECPAGWLQVDDQCFSISTNKTDWFNSSQQCEEMGGHLKEGDWRWVDNSSLTTPFWNTYKSEPDNNQAGGQEGEDCAVVDINAHEWYDVPCDFLYRRICQKKAIPLG